MNKIERLQELGKLLKSGVISADEFKSLKNELITTNEERPNLDTETSDSKNKSKSEKQTSATRSAKRVKQKNVKDLKQNNAGSASKLKIPKKKIIYATSAVICLFLLTIWIFSDNKFTQKIKETCIDCSEIEITDSDLILTTNGEGKSNVFSKSSMSFHLTEWYEAVYDEGFFYDDITFVVEGKKFTFTDENYDEISDQYFANEFNKLEEEEARLEAERNRVATYKCSICKNDFEHSGYKEISTGNWRKCKDPYQCFICSKTCGMKHTKKMIDFVGF